jgi:23S rRNA (uracil1939-C5)-methyltransferase
MKKGEIIENLTVDGLAAEGKSVARLMGQVVFLTGGAPGDVVSAEVTKVKSSFLEARVLSITQPSPHRTAPFCEHFGLCGGCSWQHIDYPTQLFYKQQQVVDNLERIGQLTLPPIDPIIGAPATRHYRNRLDFTFTASRWLTREELRGETKLIEPGLGFHMPRQYDKVFDVKNCYLQADPSNAIRLTAHRIAQENNIPYFDLRKQIGFLRTLTIRTASTGEVMVILQVTYDRMEWIETILDGLATAFPAITSANFIINGKRNDSFADLEVTCWKGNPYITEQMQRPDGVGYLRFRIGPKSFYQTNSLQAEVLYKKTWELAALTGQEYVYDLYTGTGTIACYVARQAQRVVGLEYVAAAVQDAHANAALNNISNAQFFAGDMKDLLSDGFIADHGRPDVVITDPPRAGMHESVCQTLIAARPSRIVYVSCNAATQARDLQILNAHYEMKRVQPVDMFPQTMHVENIVLLEQR